MNTSLTGTEMGGFTIQYHVTDGQTSMGPYTQSIHTTGTLEIDPVKGGLEMFGYLQIICFFKFKIVNI